jgi:hypothetical protein
VSGKLDGWDLNRWARHIATKLMGRDEHPPLPEGASALDAAGHADERGLADGALDLASPSLAADADADDDLSDSISLTDTGDAGGPRAGDGGLDLDALDLELAGMSFGSSGDAASGDDTSGTSGDDLSDSIDFSSGSDGGLDLDVAELTAQLEAFESSGARMPTRSFDGSGVEASPEFDMGAIEAIEAIGVVAPDSAVTARPGENQPAMSGSVFDFSELSLAPVDEGLPPPALEIFEPSPSSDLRLAPISGHDGLGAVVVLAGLGGPDAVRQLLASLPDSLTAPVLLYQHLEVGKHERLVDQLAKISKLPVVLAQSGGSPDGGKVTLLPAGMTATAQDDVLVFRAGDLSGLLMSIPPRESMIVVLSGTDPTLVPTILEVRDAGGIIVAQDPEVCFDAAAAEMLQAQGVDVLPALGLARRIAERWAV